MMVRTVCSDRHVCMNCPAPLTHSKGWGWYHHSSAGGCDRPRHYLPGCTP